MERGTILFAILLASQTAAAGSGLVEQLWKKSSAKAVERVMKTDHCKDSKIDARTLADVASGDASKADAFADKPEWGPCLRAVHEELHGRGGICAEDSLGYDVSYASQCKKSDAAFRAALKRMNQSQQALPQQGPAEDGQN